VSEDTHTYTDFPLNSDYEPLPTVYDMFLCVCMFPSSY